MDELRERIAQVFVVPWWCEDCNDEHDFVQDEERERADAILAAIQETHHVVPKDRGEWKRTEVFRIFKDDAGCVPARECPVCRYADPAFNPPQPL